MAPFPANPESITREQHAACATLPGIREREREREQASKRASERESEREKKGECPAEKFSGTRQVIVPRAGETGYGTPGWRGGWRRSTRLQLPATSAHPSLYVWRTLCEELTLCVELTWATTDQAPHQECTLRVMLTWSVESFSQRVLRRRTFHSRTPQCFFDICTGIRSLLQTIHANN